MNERLRLAVPTGELETDVTKFFRDIGLQFDKVDRSYFLEVKNMPLDLIAVRASSIPQLVSHDQSLIKAGMTGSDIVWESGMGEDFGENLPVHTLNPNAKQWSLYIGVTKPFANQILEQYSRSPTVADLSGNILSTEYPRIAYEYLSDKKPHQVKVLHVHGTDEAMQYAFPNCYGVLGVLSSGATVKANNIEVLDIFHQGTVKMIEAGNKLSPYDISILSDLRERIASSVEKRRWL